MSQRSTWGPTHTVLMSSHRRGASRARQPSFSTGTVPDNEGWGIHIGNAKKFGAKVSATKAKFIKAFKKIKERKRN